MATPDQPDNFTHSVRGLTRLSSQGDYVVVDPEAPYILQSATRIKKSQSPYGVFYEAYHSAKSKAKLLLSRPHQSTVASSAAVVDPSVHPNPPYDTTDWDDEQTDRKHFIEAKNVATYGTIRSGISKDFPSIRDHSYILNKFKIYQTQDRSGNPVRDYFLQILVNAGKGMTYIFAHARELSGGVGFPHIQYIRDSRYPHAQ